MESQLIEQIIETAREIQDEELTVSYCISIVCKNLGVSKEIEEQAQKAWSQR